MERTHTSWTLTRQKLLHDICLLGQALTFFKHECLHLPKADVNWSQGLLHLVLLFHFQQPGKSSWGQALKAKLLSMDVTPMRYSWPKFRELCAVYIKVAVDWRCYGTIQQYRQPSAMMYIGSTAVSVTLRESNRMSVLRKLEQGQEVQAELSIRYWHQNQCFQQFTLLQIASCSTYKQAWTLEHLLISQWQPKLNYPFVQVFLKRTALGFRPAKQQRHTAFGKFGVRLWRKFRKRLHVSSQPLCFAVTRRHAWELLFDIASFTRASFEALKLLRSERFVDDDVYAILRLSLSLEEPLKTRVRQLLKGVVRHRLMTWPSGHSSLRIPFLAHAGFAHSLERWLSATVQRFKHVLVPFHLPSRKIRETKHQACKDLLHNVPKWDQFLQQNGTQQLPCPCAQFRDRLSPVCFVQGHVATGVEMLGAIHSELQFLGQGSANSTFFPSLQQYLRVACKGFGTWRKVHGLPLCLEDDFVEFLKQQWHLHSASVQQHHRLDWRLVQRCKQALNPFVVHCEDHHPNHLMVFCPQFYFASVLRTWSDPLVFEPLSSSSDELRSWLFAQIPAALKRQYPWGVDLKGSLPVGFVLLKRKKQFLKGRTIVSYLHAPLRKLLNATAYVIQLMVRTIWPSIEESLPATWRKLHFLLRDLPTHVQLLEFNDDLVGFFNSVPRDMIVHALEVLIQQYVESTGTDMFAIDLRANKPTSERALPHRPRGGASVHTRVLHLKHVVSVVQLSFLTGVFVANHQCYRQIRGTCIGNQISPVLSSLPVILRERVWQRSFQLQIAQQGILPNHIFICRYVDNRLMLCDASCSQLGTVREFLHSGFYGSSIELEAVTDHSFLGFTISMEQRTVQYNQPIMPWQIRHFCSAGSMRVRVAGFHSRKALIQKYAWPPSDRRRQVDLLRQLYRLKGFVL